MKPSLLLTLCFFYTLFVAAQPLEFTPDDFNLTGDAIFAGEHCFELTKSEDWKGGGVWFKNQVDLSQPFEMELDLSFGCDDYGADGIVFIFYPKTKTGFEGEGIGFGGLSPSLGIEMDTYENHHLGDPPYDHLALMRDGQPNHHAGISEPVPLSRDFANIEDCKSHKAKVQWNPTTKILNFFFDGDPRLSQRLDLVKDIFNNDPLVYWGFTAATGGENNRHLVCIEKTNFSENESFDQETRAQLLSAKKLRLKEVQFESGVTELPEINIRELNKYAKMLEENPSYNLYIEAHTDNTGKESTNKRLSEKRADAVAKYLIKKGIDPKRIKSFGYGSDFPIAPNDTPEERAKNRRIEMSFHQNRA